MDELSLIKTKLKELAIEVAPDYPNIRTLTNTWEDIYAIECVIEGLLSANKDLHKCMTYFIDPCVFYILDYSKI